MLMLHHTVNDRDDATSWSSQLLRTLRDQMG